MRIVAKVRAARGRHSPSVFGCLRGKLPHRLFRPGVGKGGFVARRSTFFLFLILPCLGSIPAQAADAPALKAEPKIPSVQGDEVYTWQDNRDRIMVILGKTKGRSVLQLGDYRIEASNMVLWQPRDPKGGPGPLEIYAEDAVIQVESDRKEQSILHVELPAVDRLDMKSYETGKIYQHPFPDTGVFRRAQTIRGGKSFPPSILAIMNQPGKQTGSGIVQAQLIAPAPSPFPPPPDAIPPQSTLPAPTPIGPPKGPPDPNLEPPSVDLPLPPISLAICGPSRVPDRRTTSITPSSLTGKKSP